MTLGQIFKAVTNQRPEPWKEREATDALIEQLSDRVRDLMEQNEALRKDAERYRWLRDIDDDPCGLCAMFTNGKGSRKSQAIEVDRCIDKAMEAK